MIVFDLACDPAGHVFEAWFGSTSDYEAQKARGLVECPLCGSRAVDKAPMSPRLGTRGNKAAGSPAVPAPAAPLPMAATAGFPPEAVKAMLGAMAEAQAKALRSSDYVGPRFAEEARAIHLGEVESRTIHGQATLDEARALAEEGIEVMPLPFPVRPPATDN